VGRAGAEVVNSTLDDAASAKDAKKMAGPFPGMDPYLEAPLVWPGVHHRLPGSRGRVEYLAKQEQVIYSEANLVEVDLLDRRLRQ
jgi:hypothetical protein